MGSGRLFVVLSSLLAVGILAVVYLLFLSPSERLDTAAPERRQTSPLPKNSQKSSADLSVEAEQQAANPFRNLPSSSANTLPSGMQSELTEIDRFLDSGFYDDAEAKLKELSEKFPGQFSVVARLADLYLQRKEFSKAEENLLQLIDLEDRNPFYRSKLAEVQLMQNRPAEAVQNYENALDLNPEYGPAAAGLVVAAQTPEQVDAAISQLQTRLTQNPNPNVASVLIESMILHGRRAEGEALLQQYRNDFPSHSELNHLDATRKILQGNWKEAKPSALMSLRTDSDLSRVERRGQSYVEEALAFGEVAVANDVITELESRNLSAEIISLLKEEVERAKKAQLGGPKPK